ncbi:alpha/beta fold hydrolase [Euzebya tangerina]|uniref:alpha/beta fold hydrolase n=1 Tax=Euzebya tangerina TaxID=591198 RepID=UPI0013C2B59F|nr:alpha/beta fold hydrolase [Euzebya tangerina]
MVRVRTIGAGRTVEAGRTVLAAHGWSGGSDQLGFIVAALVDAGIRVILPDLPGHGRTPPFHADGTATFGDFAQVIGAIAAAHPLHAIVGHSGGALAALMAMRDGAHADRFVGVGMLPRLRESVDRFLDRVEATAEERATFEADGRSRFPGDVYAWTNAYRATADLQVDALLIHDVDDEAVPIVEVRALAAAWVDATLIETSRYGHHLILRRADVIAEIADFLDR